MELPTTPVAPDLSAILFDLDGTLIDSFDLHIEAWEDCCKRRGLHLDREIFVRTFGGKNAEIIPLYWQAAGAAAPSVEESAEIAEEKEALFRELAAREFPAIPGSRELLAAVAAAGFRTALASNAPAANVHLCAEAFAPHVFGALVSGDQVERGKPDPAIFLLAAHLLAVPPKRCLVIEDSPAGLAAAGAAGMRSIAIQTPTFAPEQLSAADRVVSHLRDISVGMLQPLVD